MKLKEKTIQIKIPFLQRFKTPMLNDVKTMTSRTRRYGEKGDWFKAFEVNFRLDSVEPQPFSFVIEHWKEEGCNSKEDFLSVWKQIHPRRIFLDDYCLFVHRFHRVGSIKA